MCHGWILLVNECYIKLNKSNWTMSASLQSMEEATAIITNQSNIIKSIPRLKKNKRLELRWGQQYYTDLQDAIFSVKNTCYTSTEMPVSLRENNYTCQKKYICNSCGDNFHFQSSLSDHNDRYSWILGYWCNYCYQIQCDHTIEGELSCIICRNIRKSKRAYLKMKGLQKGQKEGEILLFYNQCQFLEHMRKHDVNIVDMSDIMLMPLPHKIQRNEYLQLNHICKALMEHMFIKRIHIMDWLRINKIDWKWWIEDDSHDNMISELLKKYDDHIDPARINVDEQSSQSSEDDDDPCDIDIIPDNINFTSDNLSIPEMSEDEKPIIVSTLNKPSAKLASLTELNDSTKEKNIKISTSTSQYPSDSIQNKKIIIISQKSEIKENGKTLDNNKIPFEGITGEEKNTKTTTVIASPQLSVNSHVSDNKKNSITINKNISNGKIPDCRLVQLPPRAKVVLRRLQKPPTSILKVDFDKNSIPLVTPKFNMVKNKIKIVPAKITTPSVEQVENNIAVVTSELQKSTEHLSTVTASTEILPIANKEVVQSDITENINNLSLILDDEVTESLDKLPLNKITPKNDKVNLVDTNKRENNFQSNSDKDELSVSQEEESIIIKYRNEMEQNLQQSDDKIIYAIIDNIIDTNRKYEITKKCVDINNTLEKNCAAIKKFEKFLKKFNDHTNKNTNDKINDEFDKKICDWEIQYNNTMIKPECIKCRRKLKPMNYIPGISKPATNELKFCQCNNYICYLCDSKLGNIDRYKSHIRFHKKEAPFVCPECCEIFPTMFYLETHIWTKCFHIMTQQFFSCQICEVEGFVTMEDVTRHYAHVHARTAVFCNECHGLLNSYSNYRTHYLEEHNFDSLIPDPTRFLICEFGQCVVKPENYHAHIQTHVEIPNVTYYTCPFCCFFVKDIAKNRRMIQEHVLGNHAPRLREVITLETVRFLTGKNEFSIPSSRRYVPVAPTIKVIVPEIVDACSISSETFEHASISEKKLPIQDNFNPIIVDMKSNEINENRTIPLSQNNVIIPKILNQLENIKTTNQISMSSSCNMENDKVKLHEEEERVIEVSKSLGVVEFDLKASENCNTIEKNNKDNGDVEKTKMNEITTPSITQMKTQSEVTTESFVKAEKLNVGNLPLSPQHEQRKIEEQEEEQQQHQQQPQQLLIIEKNNNSSLNTNSIIPITENKVKIPEIIKLSTSDKVEIEKSPLQHEYLSSPQTKKKITKEIMSNIQLSINQKYQQRRPYRIALNGPNNSDIPPINYKCHLCSDSISTSQSIVNSHFREMHSEDYEIAVIAPIVTRLSSDTMKIELKDDSKKRKIDQNIATVKKRRRWTHKKFPDRSISPNLGICIKQESLQDIEGNYKCKKCECLFENVSTLREHVASNHRIREHFLICLECGENFVVAPSLQMHLKVFHGITDPITYMAQNTAYAPDMIDEFEAQERIIDSNQCYVCRSVFGDKAAVDKHIRVHGMAFLNRKRIEARNALKTPKKKSETTNSTLNTNKIDQETKEKNNTNTNNNNNNNVLPESDSANVSILTRISRLLS